MCVCVFFFKLTNGQNNSIHIYQHRKLFVYQVKQTRSKWPRSYKKASELTMLECLGDIVKRFESTLAALRSGDVPQGELSRYDKQSRSVVFKLGHSVLQNMPPVFTSLR